MMETIIRALCTALIAAAASYGVYILIATPTVERRELICTPAPGFEPPAQPNWREQ
jgi:hypothetical protein